jgi:GNAT superfamily N-acetyltransferase
MIRRAVSADRERLVAITRASVILTDEEVVWARELIFGEIHPAPGREYQIDVLDLDGEVAGYVCYGPASEDEAFDLYWIVVEPSRHRGGLGRQLLGHVERRTLEAGSRMLLIETSEQNAAARAFYVANGYAQVSQTKDFTRIRPGRVLYRRDLSD